MSDADATHDSDAHADSAGHGHVDDDAEALGDVDVAAWSAAIVGAGISILLIVALYVATQG